MIKCPGDDLLFAIDFGSNQRICFLVINQVHSVQSDTPGRKNSSYQIASLKHLVDVGQVSSSVRGKVASKTIQLLPNVHIEPVGGNQTGAPDVISTKGDVRDENLVQWAAMVEQSVVRIEVDIGEVKVALAVDLFSMITERSSLSFTLSVGLRVGESSSTRKMLVKSWVSWQPPLGVT